MMHGLSKKCRKYTLFHLPLMHEANTVSSKESHKFYFHITLLIHYSRVAGAVEQNYDPLQLLHVMYCLKLELSQKCSNARYNNYTCTSKMTLLPIHCHHDRHYFYFLIDQSLNIKLPDSCVAHLL